jgi:hypothetical protein
VGGLYDRDPRCRNCRERADLLKRKAKYPELSSNRCRNCGKHVVFMSWKEKKEKICRRCRTDLLLRR